jgi:hypothetical protein
MARRKCLFTESDLKRALHAAQAVGVPVKIAIEDGRMTITMIEPAQCKHPGNKNEWDEVFEDGEG